MRDGKPGLTLLRGLAAVAVAVFHLQNAWGAAGGHRTRLLGLGWFGVDVFFVLSAFLLSPAWVAGTATWATYVRHRFLRLAPPYYASMLLILTLAALSGTVATTTWGWADVALHVVFLHNWVLDSYLSISPIYWTLGLEANLYVVLPLLAWLARTPRTRWALLGLAAGSMLLRGLTFPGPHLGWAFQLTGFLAPVVAGVLAAQAPERWARWWWTAGLGLLALYLWMPDSLPVATTAADRLGHAVVRPLVGVAMACLAARLSLLRSAPLQGLGAASYSLYLVHVPVLVALEPVLPRSPAAFWLLGALAVAAATVVFYWGVERVSLQWIRRLRRTQAPASQAPG